MHLPASRREGSNRTPIRQIGSDRAFLNRIVPYTNQLIKRISIASCRVREAIGPDVNMTIERHWKYSLSDAVTLLNALEHVEPMWLEDPLPAENTEPMAKLARMMHTPICTGENL
jgi:L-alanine-DL-glutamate epimerase-like enolase superfamily enzyme